MNEISVTGTPKLILPGSPGIKVPAHSDCGATARARVDDRVTRFGDWTYREDPAPGDEPAVYVMVCKGTAADGTPCGLESGPLRTAEEAREWTRKHTQFSDARHRKYRLIADVPFEMVPKVEPL
ncbi:hypothetical protein CFP65_3309 [Kitasatospora sp. MMS16-BH015]|uniref:DUF7848 domain-containing protein n=1 Tax=Kitasatospora sp. MMS16-BH015 TaxID=2018025 RepID=UPI000CA11987|nr:hypothetical protein [Kitasatospora sp. MMS16-BH015]AUG78109.1 hypothetical protein CFP65_3309 [Kitasatospora sp. MMS16-BH015]